MPRPTFVQLRQWLGFGVVRLKILLALYQATTLDTPGFKGRFVASVGPSGQVKARVYEPEQPLEEVTLPRDLAA